ncbi:uncharacterized protein At5g01610 [Abrus precatorius]|uniref:Uncharacterized protein At5g01610 n=1 Tax=Abrus precatorius TaxID=3816 RepID=A0A8B8L1B5_ABRPR|nr:uncharacterized protein At5g01610 [Abrus precatorius]
MEGSGGALHFTGISPRALILFLCLLCSTIRIVSTGTRKDIHELLPEYGFPKGIIPNNVESYTLSSDGSFTIQLKTPCYVHFHLQLEQEVQVVYYHTQITGVLSYGSLRHVSGIQAQKLFLWLSVTGIEAHRDVLEFFVGALSQKLPATQFQDVPACSRTRSHPITLLYPF